MGLRTHLAALAPSRTIERLFIDLFSLLRPCRTDHARPRRREIRYAHADPSTDHSRRSVAPRRDRNCANRHRQDRGLRGADLASSLAALTAFWHGFTNPLLRLARLETAIGRQVVRTNLGVASGLSADLTFFRPCAVPL